VQAPGASLRLIAGEPRTYVRLAESGNRRVQAFCPACGTPLWSVADSAAPASYTLRVGALAQRDRLPPRRQYWCRSAQSWLPVLQGLEWHERE